MSNLESNKSLAGIGALLLAFGSFIPIVGIIGIILLLIGIKGLADYYKDSGIYNNALRGVIFGVIGLVAVAAIVIGLIRGMFSISTVTPAAGIGAGFFAIGVLVIALVLLFVFYLLAALNFRRAFSMLAQKSGEQMFETAGLLLFIGAILAIILVGLVLVLIAWILVAVAFFSIRTPYQTNTYVPPASASTSPTAMEYCPNCGAPVKPNDAFCPHCGKQLR